MSTSNPDSGQFQNIAETVPASAIPPKHPPGFRARRGLNWGVVGLMYTSFYMCRYNFSIANKAISDEFHFNLEQMGWIITVNMWAYACGQIINGILTDKFGGKRAMLIGAAGTIILNIAFGMASFWGILGLFITLRGIDGYLQSFGAPGMIKINVAWFNKTERGRFAGIFGFMINLGRFGINKLGPSLLAGFSILGLWHVPALHWRWLFWVPAIIAAIVAVLLALFVKNTPEEAGYVVPDLQDKQPDGTVASPKASEPTFGQMLLKIASNPVIWIVALAYACTGAVRQGVDQWFPRYMQEVFSLKMEDRQFQWLGFLLPFVASLGSLISGYVSDKLFKGSRTPVAAAIYFIETIIIITASQITSANGIIVFFVLIAFTANSTHSLMGTAAAMDIGGKKMAGFASGLIDSFQYFGGSLSGFLLGKLMVGKMTGFFTSLPLVGDFLGRWFSTHTGWNIYFYFMAPFGFIGCCLMLFAGRVSRRRGMSI